MGKTKNNAKHIYSAIFCVLYLTARYFRKKVVYHREMMGEYLKIDWWEWRYYIKQIVCVNHMQSVFIWRKYGFKRY